MENQDIKTALKQSNFILYALQNRIEEDYKQTIEDTIELNRKILASLEHQEQKPTRKPYNPSSSEVDIRNDLMLYGLMTQKEVEDNRNISLIRQLKNYKEKNGTLYLNTMDKINAYASKHSIEKLQAYIIGTMKKEYAKRDGKDNG